MPTIKKKWTYDDYCKLGSDKRFELTEGELIEMAPSPRPLHQQILNNLLTEINIFLRKKRLGITIPSPIDVKLDDLNIVQPDIIFISETNKGIIGKTSIIGTPDLVIEILSPSTEKRDRNEKFTAYEKFGVKEYWIVDPKQEKIEVFVNEQSKLILFCHVEKDKKLESNLLQHFTISYSDLLIM